MTADLRRPVGTAPSAARRTFVVVERLRQSTVLFAVVLAIALLIANIAYLPGIASPSQVPNELGTLAPFVLAAMASTPSILAGGGGIDLSIAPLMGLSNVVFVVYLLPHGLGNPFISIPLLVIMGAGVGCVNGIMVAVLRFPPVIATLGTYFVLGGIDLSIASGPVPTAPNWTNSLATTTLGFPGALLSIGVPLVSWFLICRSPYHRALIAVGGDDIASYSAGVNVALVRVIAYTFGGALAAVAGVALTGTIQSADVTVWPQYVLIALAAVALGGTALGGGRGGLVGSVLGAACVFLIQNLISAAGVQVFYLQVAYGAVLLVAVVLGSRLARRPSESLRASS